MASGKDIMGRPPIGLPNTANGRSNHPRTHTHSLSVGAINSTHRISRRKSSSSNASNAVTVALGIAAGNASESGSGSKRNSKLSKAAFATSLPAGSGFDEPDSFDAREMRDMMATLAPLPETKGIQKARARRASEGSRLVKGEGKRQPGGELKCDKCGKGYKHSSCLYKHLWEHTPEWALTSKLLISKHQQVQLLEAASVLVAMNTDAAVESETSSPPASGSSDVHSERASSLETTPPPEGDNGRPANVDAKRLSTNSSVYSQSYQSVFSEGHSGSRPYMSHVRQWSSDTRPTTSGASVADSQIDEDQADLAAAVGLLSCSLGTPKSGPVMLPSDAPPVPPLPARYLDQKAEHLSGSTITPLTFQQKLESLTAGSRHDTMILDDEDERRSREGRSDEEEEGMFGKMEE